MNFRRKHICAKGEGICREVRAKGSDCRAGILKQEIFLGTGELFEGIFEPTGSGGIGSIPDSSNGDYGVTVGIFGTAVSQSKVLFQPPQEIHSNAGIKAIGLTAEHIDIQYTLLLSQPLLLESKRKEAKRKDSFRLRRNYGQAYYSFVWRLMYFVLYLEYIIF